MGFIFDKMKLAAAFIATASAFTPVQSNECYAANVDIDGNYFRTNVVETLKAVYSPQECQEHCKRWEKRGCQNWVFQEAKSKCELYKDIIKLSMTRIAKPKSWAMSTDACRVS